MLKYQNVAKVGDRIRAFDFKDNPDCYVEGKVYYVDLSTEQGFKCFHIIVENDVWSNPPHPLYPRNGSRIGYTFFVPMHLTSDWDGRVVKLA